MSRCLFVTGKLAAPSLCRTLEAMPHSLEYECAVLPISVAALMDTRYIAAHLTEAMGCDRLIIPGLCAGDPRLIEEKLGVEVICGPKCLKDIPGFLGEKRRLQGYGAYGTKIIAEIVDAYRMAPEAILEQAEYYRTSGADIIDLGCPVEEEFRDIAAAIKILKSAGFQVSVDSFNEATIRDADRAGVDLVLSINSRNMALAPELGCKVVVIPDFEKGLESLDRNIVQLEEWGVPFIIDPVLKPIGFGFADSVCDYISVRRKYPGAEMLMGTGNLTELTDADSTGITAVMAGIVAESGIDYVLTTEVISWARGNVREMDIARRMMHYACAQKVLPKHIDEGLITVKDPPFETYAESELREMQKNVRDRNFRIFVGKDSMYVFNKDLFVKGTDVQSIFKRLDLGGDASQAFYLGRELQKAALALQLGKKYVQERELRWGYMSSGMTVHPG